METKLLAARVQSWQDFKIRKLAAMRNQKLGFVLGEAIQVYCSEIPQEIIDEWLEEYKKIDEVDKMVG